MINSFDPAQLSQSSSKIHIHNDTIAITFIDLFIHQFVHVAAGGGVITPHSYGGVGMESDELKIKEKVERRIQKSSKDGTMSN